MSGHSESNRFDTSINLIETSQIRAILSGPSVSTVYKSSIFLRSIGLLNIAEKFHSPFCLDMPSFVVTGASRGIGVSTSTTVLMIEVDYCYLAGVRASTEQ